MTAKEAIEIRKNPCAEDVDSEELSKAIDDALEMQAKIVHCKDCKHWHKETGWCNEHSHFIDDKGDFCHPWESNDWKEFDADYFCADGEIKDRDEEK